MRFIDAHVHLHEFPREEVEEFAQMGICMVAVSDDYESSLKTLELRDSFPESVRACVGIHPWSIPKSGLPSSELERVLDLVREADCVGEVGVDLRFVPETFELQREVFRALAAEAVKAGKPLNVHAAGAWREALGILEEVGAASVLIHWYTGPPDLLGRLMAKGYFVSLNPALRVQRKHRELAATVSLSAVLTESDGPYEYRGLRLSPRLIPELVAELAALRGVEPESLSVILQENYKRLFPP